MLAALKRGDRVVTGGGIIGTVQRVPRCRQERQAGASRDRGGDRAQYPGHGAARHDLQRGEADARRTIRKRRSKEEAVVSALSHGCRVSCLQRESGDTAACDESSC